FYQAAITDPENPEAVIAYGNCFAQLARIKKFYYQPGYRLYNAAIAVYNLLPNDPTAQNNVTICLTLRDAANRDEKIKRQQLEASMAALSTIGGAVSNAASQQIQRQNNTADSPSQASDGGSAGSSSGKRSNYDISNARNKYRQLEDAAKAAYEAVLSAPTQTGQRQRFSEAQSKMRKIRQEAANNGQNLNLSDEWEKKSLPKS
ncbi:hypothetical protein, partial [Treponema sp. R80B11-R83G3]